jgi:hypothetical protein
MMFKSKEPVLLTREQVANYLGSEVSPMIPPNENVGVYRPKSELEKIIPQLKGIPIFDSHVFSEDGIVVSGKAKVIGSVGDDVSINEKGEVRATVYVYDRAALPGKRGVSLGYRHTQTPEFGEFNGQKYMFKQSNLEIDHVALVPLGRAGHDARIGDLNKQVATFDSAPAFYLDENEFIEVQDLSNNLTDTVQFDNKDDFKTTTEDAMPQDITNESTQPAQAKEPTIADLMSRLDKLEAMMMAYESMDSKKKSADEAPPVDIEGAVNAAVASKLKEKQELDAFVEKASKHVGAFKAASMDEAVGFAAKHLKIEGATKELLEGVFLAKSQMPEPKAQSADSATEFDPSLSNPSF